MKSLRVNFCLEPPLLPPESAMAAKAETAASEFQLRLCELFQSILPGRSNAGLRPSPNENVL